MPVEKKTVSPKAGAAKPETPRAVQPGAPAPGAVQKDGMSDFITGPFRKWWDFIRINPVGYWLGLVRISLASTLVYVLFYILMLAALVGVVFALGGVGEVLKMAPLQLVLLIALFGIVFLVGSLAIAWLASSISMTSIAYTDARLTGGSFSISECFSRIKYRVLKFLLALTGILFAVRIPLYLLFAAFIAVVICMALASSAYTGLSLVLLPFGMMFYLVFYLLVLMYIFLLLVFYAAFAFVAQFWLLGIVLEGKGVVVSLKRSFAIVKASPLESFLFCVLWAIGTCIASLPMMAFVFVIYIGVFASVYIVASLGVLWGGVIVAFLFLLDMLISVLLGSITSAFSQPTQILFWKSARDRMEKAQA